MNLPHCLAGRVGRGSRVAPGVTVTVSTDFVSVTVVVVIVPLVLVTVSDTGVKEAVWTNRVLVATGVVLSVSVTVVVDVGPVTVAVLVGVTTA